MIEYREDEMLMLSGIQHFAFCRRQWALIHLFGEWRDNALTFEGQWLHKNVDDLSKTRIREGIIEVHSVAVASARLGLRGFCDVVELLPCDAGGAEWPGFDGRFKIQPIEYKRGTEKFGLEDELQLCAQAMCLEEANKARIDCGAIYYGKNRRRSHVVFSGELRGKVEETSKIMHEIYDNPVTQPAVYSKKCEKCSMFEICRPRDEFKSEKLDLYLNLLFFNEKTS